MITGLPDGRGRDVRPADRYCSGVMWRTATEFDARSISTTAEPMVHGYPPPARAAGTAVVAYCGARTIVRGESSSDPPPDTCPECVAIWKRQPDRSLKLYIDMYVPTPRPAAAR